MMMGGEHSWLSRSLALLFHTRKKLSLLGWTPLSSYPLQLSSQLCSHAYPLLTSSCIPNTLLQFPSLVLHSMT